MQDRIILPITPQSGMRFVPNSTALFLIPEDCPVACGLPRRSKNQPKVKVSAIKKQYRDLWEALGGENYNPRKKKKEIRYGCPHCLNAEGLRLKRRLERLKKYKEDLYNLCKEQGFNLPVSGWALYFYVPMPLQWSLKKKKLMQGQLNMAKPDSSNYLKIFEDSISTTDERNAQMSGLGKFWIDASFVDADGVKQRGEGYIEILINQKLHNPFNVVFIDQDALNAAPKRKWIRKEIEDKTVKLKKVIPIRLKNDELK